MAKARIEHGQTRKLGELKPHPRNSRTHSEVQIEQIAASMGEFAFTIPILIDDKGVILAGHGRQLAGLKKWGAETEVPVTIAHGWSEQKKRGYIIADNRLTEQGGWNQELLRGEMMELQGFFPDLSPLGFTKLELGDLLRAPQVWKSDPEEVPDLPTDPVSQLGDMWMLGDHRIICGDSTDREVVVRLLDGTKPHLMVTDPPYGVNYDADWRNSAQRASGKPFGGRAVGKVKNDDRVDWTAAWALFDGDVAYVWHGALYVGDVGNQLKSQKLQLRALIVWNKSNFAVSRGHYHWKHETLWYAVREGASGHWSGDRSQTTVWDIAKPQKSETGHSTQKPIECMRRPIENNSDPGEAVYDPFVGSGTTIMAAEMTGRRCYAVELNPAYVDVVIKRWCAFTGNLAVNESGDTFEKVAAARGLTISPSP